MSTPVRSSDTIGRNSAACRAVNATRVPMDTGPVVFATANAAAR